MPNPIKEVLLNRGWAGETLSRSETVERLDPLIRQHIELNRYYRSVIQSHEAPAVTEALERVQKTARADVGKLSETIHSCGGTPCNGTDLKPEDFALEGGLAETLSQLKTLETEFHDALVHERREVEHQMRTRGILEALASNSQDRFDLLNGLLDHVQKHS